jgi:hypothetical protein
MTRLERKVRQVTGLLAAGLIVLAATMLPVVRAVAQKGTVTDANLKEMIAKAKTSADHEAIAAYYDNEAADNEQKAHLHRDAANIYGKPIAVAHCNGLVRAFKAAADQDKALAAYHHRMARKAEGGQ